MPPRPRPRRCRRSSDRRSGSSRRHRAGRDALPARRPAAGAGCASRAARGRTAAGARVVTFSSCAISPSPPRRHASSPRLGADSRPLPSPRDAGASLGQLARPGAAPGSPALSRRRRCSRDAWRGRVKRGTLRELHAALAMCVCAWAPRQEVRASRTVGLRERRASVRGKTATPHCNRVVRPWPCTSGVVGRVRGRVTTVSDGMSDGDRVECVLLVHPLLRGLSVDSDTYIHGSHAQPMTCTMTYNIQLQEPSCVYHCLGSRASLYSVSERLTLSALYNTTVH